MSACGPKSESSSFVSENGETVAPTSSSNGNCILSYQSKLDELLTLEDIQKHYKLDMAIAKKKYDINKRERYRYNDIYTYAWKSDRIKTKEFKGSKIEFPVDNQIGLAYLGDDLYRRYKDKSPLENFLSFYRNASQEEIDKGIAITNGLVKKMEGVTEEQAKAAADITNGLKAKTRFKDVDGVGDAAAWVVEDSYLVVLAGDVTFKVIADIGGEEAERIELAKKLAAEVLKKCR